MRVRRPGGTHLCRAYRHTPVLKTGAVTGRQSFSTKHAVGGSDRFDSPGRSLKSGRDSHEHCRANGRWHSVERGPKPPKLQHC